MCSFSVQISPTNGASSPFLPWPSFPLLSLPHPASIPTSPPPRCVSSAGDQCYQLPDIINPSMLVINASSGLIPASATDGGTLNNGSRLRRHSSDSCACMCSFPSVILSFSTPRRCLLPPPLPLPLPQPPPPSPPPLRSYRYDNVSSVHASVGNSSHTFVS